MHLDHIISPPETQGRQFGKDQDKEAQVLQELPRHATPRVAPGGQAVDLDSMLGVNRRFAPVSQTQNIHLMAVVNQRPRLSFYAGFAMGVVGMDDHAVSRWAFLFVVRVHACQEVYLPRARSA
jgi:hypothetical protein